jgi:hypothetical protein
MSTSTHLPKLNRRELKKLQLTPIHRARNWSKADVSLLEWPVGSGNQLVIKDFANRPLWFRFILARALMRREWRTLRALQDMEQVPTAHFRVDADAFLMDYCQGEQICNVKESEMPHGLTSEIETLVQAIHKRGVTHGDLHSNNVLIGGDTHGFALIDWATACYFGPNPRGWRKALFHELVALDDRAVAKMKVHYHPSSLTERQRDLLLNGGSAIYRGFKRLRYFFEKLRGKDKSAHRASIVSSYEARLKQHAETQPTSANNQDQHI